MNLPESLQTLLQGRSDHNSVLSSYCLGQGSCLQRGVFGSTSELTHTHTYTHTDIHTHTYTHMYIHIHTLLHTCTHTNTCTHTLTHLERETDLALSHFMNFLNHRYCLFVHARISSRVLVSCTCCEGVRDLVCVEGECEGGEVSSV